MASRLIKLHSSSAGGGQHGWLSLAAVWLSFSSAAFQPSSGEATLKRGLNSFHVHAGYGEQQTFLVLTGDFDGGSQRLVMPHMHGGNLRCCE